MAWIPHTDSPTEVRQAFQRLGDQTDVITTGLTDYILIGQGIGVAPVWEILSTAIDHGGLGGLTDVADHPGYLLIDGSRGLTGNMLVDAAITIDGRDISEDGIILDAVDKFFDGTFQESFDAVATSDGATVIMSLEQTGGGDLSMQFSDGHTTLDCTDPLQTIALTAGTDTSPQANYIYIPQSTKVLTKSTSVWPAGEHIKIAYFFVPSAAFVQSNGCYVNQNWNDHQAGADLQGHMAHMSEKLRRLGATWFSGVNANGATASYFTIGAGTTHWLSTSGEVDQLHEHTFPAVETSGSDIVLVVNQNGAAYDDITNLYSITDDHTGATIGNNKYFNLVFWGVVNKSGEFAALMVNLPGGFYTKQSDALIDSDGHDVYAEPREFSIDSGTAFLICRATFQMGGTWSHVSTTDLRGLTPATASGSSVNDHGGLGGLTDVADHPAYLLTDGTRNITGNLAVDGGITIDGRDLSADGTKLDGIEALADVTDATNVAAAGAAMAGGAFHDGFSDFVGNEHLDWTAASANLATTGSISAGTGDGSALLHIGTVGGSELVRLEAGATSNPFFTFFQTTTRRAFIQFNDTNNNLILASEYGTLSFKAASSAGSDTDTTYLTIEVGGNVLLANSLQVTNNITGGNVTGGADPGHTHTGDSLSGIDISADTNLAVSVPIILTDDTLSLDINSLSIATIAAGDFVPFWDITATADNKKITFANFEGTLNHDSLTGYVGNEHIDHSTVSISSGTGLSGGGTIAATRTLALSHLGIEDLADAGADKILFWDDGASKTDWLTVGVGLTLSGTELTGGFTTRARAEPAAVEQDIVTSTWTKITLGTENYDGGGDFASSTFTAPANGYYVIGCAVRTAEALAAGKYLLFSIYKNGVTYSRVSDANHSATGAYLMGLTLLDVLYLVANDTIDIWVWHDHGANRKIWGTGIYTFLSVHRLS